MSKYHFILFFFIAFLFSACFRTEDIPVRLHAPFMMVETDWADSMILDMTLDEKIGQLIFLKTDLKDGQKDALINLAQSGKIGGLLLQNQKLETFIHIVDTIQSITRFPLFIATEERVSLCNQFSDLENFPSPASIGSMTSKVGTFNHLTDLLVDQCEVLGINFSFAPSINLLEKRDSFFDDQAFSNNQEEVILQSSLMMDKLQSKKIISIASSFNDLHYDIAGTDSVIDSLLHRYYNLTQNGVSGFQVGQKILELDSMRNLQTYFLKNYLRNELEFSGLLVAELDEKNSLAKAIHTGTDIFVVSDSVEMSIAYIKNFLELGLMTQKTLNEKVYKVLLAKDWLGLKSAPVAIDKEKVKIKMNVDYFDYYLRQLYEGSMILAHNYKSILPFKKINKKKFRLVEVGQNQLKTFEKNFKYYDDFTRLHLMPTDSTKLSPLSESYKKTSIVLTLDEYELNEKKDSSFIASVNQLSHNTDITIVNFGNPTNLTRFDTTMSLVQLFEKNKLTEEFAAQLIFGGTNAKGMLPLDLAKHLKAGQSNETPIIRLKYTVPEEVGIASHKLVGIDAIAYNAILSGEMPGCQVLVAKAGKVIYSKSFGYHSYDKKRPVRNSDLYDLASITKIAATTLGSMKLYEQHKYKMSDRISKYIPVGKKSRIRNISFKQLFTHRSGLQANMPIASFLNYRDTSQAFCNEYFCKEKDFSHTVPIANSMYMDNRWVDSLWQKVYKLKPYKNKRYRYSDVNFNLIQKLVETVSKKPLDQYLNKNFYSLLNIDKCLYNPLDRFSELDIIPTEYDEKWRKQVVNGYVHDEGAALQGGVAGNAGLFANAEDLAVLLQMLLNEGSYGGEQFLKKETIKYFTRRHGSRGLGFDLKKSSSKHACSSKASTKTFGHTGFTGTSVWVDPKSELVFIFLANRIYPDIKNRKIYRKGTRKRIHTVIYKAFDSFDFEKEVKQKSRTDLKKAQIPRL